MTSQITKQKSFVLRPGFRSAGKVLLGVFLLIGGFFSGLDASPKVEPRLVVPTEIVAGSKKEEVKERKVVSFFTPSETCISIDLRPLHKSRIIFANQQHEVLLKAANANAPPESALRLAILPLVQIPSDSEHEMSC